MELLDAGTAMSGEESSVLPQPETGKHIRLANALLLTDFSPSSVPALPYAVASAHQYSGTVYLVHVISPEMYEYLPPELVPQMRTEIKIMDSDECNNYSPTRNSSRCRMRQWCAREGFGTP
jgi:hypothetical protein